MSAKPHLLQAIDWKKFSAAEWVEQFGVWVQTDNVCGCGYPSPLAAAIDRADTKRVRKAKPRLPMLKITDDEARAVQRILLDMLADTDVEVSQWAWVLILKYEGGWTWPSIAGSYGWSVNRVRVAEKEGLAWFRGRVLS
jgi:hypothetical protein